MAENKNALVNETANETGNAALAERLDNVAERMAEAEKATAAVAEEQKQRLAEQEQNTEQLQKAEEERRAQAAEAAKSEADRRAAALDYTENYRQNQKIEKAARATVSKAKMERLAAEAEAKAKAEREAEEALQREREELMARRNRSSELLKKVENDSETQAPEAKNSVAAPAQEAAPAEAPAPAEEKVVSPQPSEASVEMPEVAATEEAAPAEDAPAEQISAPDETPDIPDVNLLENVSEEALAADDAASAEESAPEALADADSTIDIDSNNNEALAQMVDGDLERASEEAQAVADKVDEDLLKTRIAQMMPARLIPESLRLYKTSDKEKYDRKAKLRSPSLPNQAEIDGAFKRLEDAVAAAEKSSEARLAAALGRVEYMTDRALETANRLDSGDTAAPKIVKAVNVGEPTRRPSNAAIAAAAASSGSVGDSVLPEVYDSKEFASSSELNAYLKRVKKNIKEKKQDLAQTTKEKGESKEDFERRRMERRAALLGVQLGNIALLSRKGYPDEAEKFMGDAETSVDQYNQGVEKYNRVAEKPIDPLPENTVARVAKEGRLPEFPFGSAAAGLDAALRGGAFEADQEAQKDRAQEKALRKEMQKEMLLHAMEWNPEAASTIKDKVDEYTAEKAEKKKRKQQKKDAEAEQAKDASDEQDSKEALKDAHHIALAAEREGRRADKEGRSSEELYEAYKEADAEEKRGRKAKKQSSKELYATYLATVAEEKKESASDKHSEDKKEKHRVSNAIHAAYVSTEEDEKNSSEDKNRVSDALGEAYAESLKEEKKSQTAEKKKKSEALKAAYLAAKEEEEKAEKDEARPSEVLRAAYLASEKTERENGTFDEEDSVSRSLKAAYLAAEEKEKDKDSENSDALEAAYFAAREEEKKADSDEEDSSASDMLLAAYVKAKDEDKKGSSEKKSDSEALHAAYKKSVEEEKAEESESDGRSSDEKEASKKEKKKQSEELYASYLASLAEEKKVDDRKDAEDRDASDEDADEDADEEDDDEFDGDWDSWEENYAKDMPRTAKTIRETYHQMEPERKKQLEELQRRFLYEQTHANFGDKEFPAEDIYQARDELKQAEQVRTQAEEHFASKETIADIRKATEDYAAATKRAEWLPDSEETEKTIRSIAQANRATQIATDRLIKEQEASIRAAAEQAKQEANVALDRIAKDYEEQVRACAEAERETLLFASLQASDNEKAAAKDERLAAKAEREDAHFEKLYYAKVYSDETTAEKELAAAAKKAERLAAEADRSEERLEKLRLAKDATDKSTALSLENKTKMLMLAVAAASEMQDATAEQRMRKQVAALAKKEAKAVSKAEKREKKLLSRHESDFAFIEAKARASEQEVERLENALVRLHAEHADEVTLQAAFNEVVQENSKAVEARRAATVAKKKLEAERESTAQKMEAKDAMLAFAAAMGAKKVGKTKLSSPGQKSRYLAIAIANAERNYDRAMLAIANADDQALYLKETNATAVKLEEWNRTREKLSLKAAYAEEKLLALRATKEVLDTSTVMSKREKAELLSLAVSVADDKNAKSVERLNKRVAHFAKKEAAAARRADRAFALNVNRWDRHVAAEEAKARISEKSARDAKAKAERLAIDKAEKLRLHEAYERALVEEAIAEKARKSADEAKTERDEKRERADSHKEAKAALLAFAGAFAATEKRSSKDSKKKKELSAAEKQKLDAAIQKAEHSYEDAVSAENASNERSKELAHAAKADRKAAKKAERISKDSVVHAEDHLDTLRAAKSAIKKSHVLSREEKSEMISLVMEMENEAKRAKATEKLKKKIAAAAKKEAKAAKQAAHEEKRYTAHKERTAFEAEAAALLSESNAIAARAKADRLFAKRANAKSLEKAYSRALAEEAKADRARIASDGAKEKIAAERELVAEHIEAKEAMLAFAAAVALEEKNKKAKKTKNTSSAPLKEGRKLDAAIAKATERYERAEAEFSAAREKLLSASDKHSSQAELQEIYRTFARFEIEKTRAKAELETLESAKMAVQKAQTLSSAEKAEMLSLLLLAKTEKKNTNAAARLKKKIDVAAKREEIAARKASKKNDYKAKRLENAYLAKAAKALAAEEIAQDAKQKAIRLTGQKANKKELYKAYRQALLEQSKAENAKRASEQTRAKYAVATANTESHKEAKMALLSFAAAFAAEEKLKTKNLRPQKHAADVKASYLDAVIIEAERSYEQALANSTASKMSARALDEKRVSAKDLAAVYKEALLAEDEADRAAERIQSLRAARDVAEKSTGLSAEEKADMLAFIEEENTLQQRIRRKEKLQKHSRAITEQTLKKGKKTWEESVALYEAKALVKEDAASRLAKKIQELRDEEANRKALEKAYKQALMEEASAEKARKKADAARLERKAEKDDQERLAALALTAKRKNDRRNADRTVKRTAAEADIYARACEAKAELSANKALLLASKKGKKNEKLKAYETALLDRYTAVQARAEAETMQSEGISEKTVAESRKERRLRQAVEKNVLVYDQALEKLREKQEKNASRGEKKHSDALETAEISEAAVQSGAKTKLEKKQEKEALAREKKRIKIERKVRKADEKAQGRAAAAKNNPRLAAKLQYEALKAERQKIADAKAWELMIKRDEALDRQNSYMMALNQEKKDLARIAEKAEAAKASEASSAVASVADPKATAPAAVLGRRERVRRFKEFCKLDVQVLASRYDYEIAEVLRELELTLADFTCTPVMRRRAEYEAKRKVAMLKSRKHAALRQQKADNKRYMACLRARSITPKNRRVSSLALIEMRNRLFELLEQRNFENERLKSLCYPDAYRDAKKVATPWHKAFLKEKKRWQKKCRMQMELIDELHLGRTEKQKLRAELDRFATAHADIAEAKVRARKMTLRGVAKLRHKQELQEMKREVRRSRKRMKQKFKAAMARSDRRNFWAISLLYLAVAIVIVVDVAIVWWIFGEDIVRFLNAHFPGIMSRLK